MKILYFRRGKSARVVIEGIVGHILGYSHKEGALHSLYVDGVADHLDHRADGIVNNEGGIYILYSIAKLLGVVSVSVLKYLKRGRIDLKIADVVHYSHMILVRMSVDAKDYTVLFSLICFVDNIKHRFFVLNSIRSFKALVGKENAR